MAQVSLQSTQQRAREARPNSQLTTSACSLNALEASSLISSSVPIVMKFWEAELCVVHCLKEGKNSQQNMEEGDTDVPAIVPLFLGTYPILLNCYLTDLLSRCAKNRQRNRQRSRRGRSIHLPFCTGMAARAWNRTNSLRFFLGYLLLNGHSQSRSFLQCKRNTVTITRNLLEFLYILIE